MTHIASRSAVTAETRILRAARPAGALLIACLLALLTLAAPVTAIAHGETDESVEAFHEHLDDYQAEIAGFLAGVDPIVASYAAGEDVAARIDALVEGWEEVEVHGAIETHAIVTYPTIWQAVIALKQAAAEGRPASDVQAAGEGVKAALWQGFGALRLAASQVEAGADHHAGESGAPEESAADSIAAIIAALEQAVQSYADGDPKAAQKLIHDAYMQRFEFLEGDLIELDADLVSRLEEDFNATLPLLIQQGADLGAVRERLASMVGDLEHAGDLLAEARASRSEVF